MASVAQIVRRRRARSARRRAGRAQRQAGLAILAVLVLLLVVIPAGVTVGAAVWIYLDAARLMPDPQATITVDPLIGATELYDRSSSTLLFAGQNQGEREWLRLADLPPYVAEATLTAEDPVFLRAAGFQPLSTFTRLWLNLINGPLPPDMTLTGRLVRNTIAPLDETVSVTDIGREIALVAEVNRRYTPEQILEWHLNTNYYGNEAYGIDAAAQTYLGKRAVELTLDEAALLAAIPLAPQYNPFDNETAARSRQSDLLRALRTAGAITGDQFEQAAATRTPILTGVDQPQQIAPEFTIYARRQAEHILNTLGRDGERLVARGGLRIVTTLDLDLYYQSECALRTHLARLKGETTSPNAMNGQPCQASLYLPPDSAAGDEPPDSGSVVIIDVDTGEILSLIGPALPAAYQPGPTLMPFVYFEGFRNPLFNPARMVLDIPTTFPGAVEGLIYTPQNPDGKFRGPINLRDAMSAGLLPPAVQVARSQGINNILLIAHRIGLNSLGDDGRYDLSLLERGGAVSPLDLTYAYSVFASMGYMRGVRVDPVGRGYRQLNPVAVQRIEDGEGNVLWQYSDEQIAANQVNIFPRGIGYLINDILSDQEARRRVLGEGRSVELNRTAAVVSGLAGDAIESWTVGYTPQRAAGVHLGRADKQPMTIDRLGLDGAAPVWKALMEYVHARDGLPPVDWPRPDDVVETGVCERSGLLPNDVCPVRNEIFLAGFVPGQIDSYWQSVEINSQTGQLATASTPTELRRNTVFFIPPSEADDWWRANNMPLPPTEFDTVSRPELFSSVQILQPQAFAYVGGVIDIRGTLDPTNMQYYYLAYGQGPNPNEWNQIGAQQTEFQRGTSLGKWDTTGLNGLYNILLTVVMNDNTRESKSVPVTVDNTPPTISLSAGEPGRIYQFPTDQVIVLEAAVEDDYSINRVEFYHNGQFVGTDESWPYGFEWQITRTGTERFSAVAFDLVGNQASSQIEVEVRRA